MVSCLGKSVLEVKWKLAYNIPKDNLEEKKKIIFQNFSNWENPQHLCITGSITQSRQQYRNNWLSCAQLELTVSKVVPFVSFPVCMLLRRIWLSILHSLLWDSIHWNHYVYQYTSSIYQHTDGIIPEPTLLQAEEFSLSQLLFTWKMPHFLNYLYGLALVSL